MKSVYQIVSFITVLLYVTGILGIGYFFTFQSSQLSKAFQAFPEFAYLTLGVILVGLIALIFLFLRADNKMEVVYVTDQDSEAEKTRLNDQTSVKTDGNAGNSAFALFERVIHENQGNKKTFFENLLKNICNQLEASVGAIYLVKVYEGQKIYEMVAGYAIYRADNQVIAFQDGEGLVGQVAKDGKFIRLTTIPEGYIEVVSGLGHAHPKFLALFPVKDHTHEVLAVVELASFRDFAQREKNFMEEVALLLAKEIETKEYHQLSL
jgi:GAF domain-containing protein